MSQIKLSHIHVGAPHFRSKLLHARNNGYTQSIIMNEFLDFPIQNSSNINIKYSFENETNNIYKLEVSDDYPNGFEYILSSGSNNPINFGYQRDGHNSDEDTSEFGTGTKQAAVAMSHKFTIITKIQEDKYYKIVLDFREMQNVEDVNESYNPTMFTSITKEEYNQIHPYEHGSTLILEEITTDQKYVADQKSFIDNCKMNIADTYRKILDKNASLNILVNNERIVPSVCYFKMPICQPFNAERAIIVKKNTVDGNKIILEFNEKDHTMRMYNSDTMKYSKIKTKREIKELLDLNNYYETGLIDNDHNIAKINGTGTQFIPNNQTNERKLPRGNINVYKSDRYHGTKITEHSNGVKNFVYIELSFKSKSLGKDLGANYNKTINLNKDNTIINALIKSCKDMTTKLEYDTSTCKSVKIYNIALEYGIEVASDKIPTEIKEQHRKEQSMNPVVEEPYVVEEPDVDVVEEPNVVEEPDVDVVEEPEPSTDPSPLTEEDADEDEDNDSVSSILTDVTPIIIHMGPGTQTRMKKGQIENVFQKIKSIIIDSTITNRKLFEIKASNCIAEMLHEFANHNTRIPEYVYDLAVSNGFDANTTIYLNKVENRVPMDYVPGGSKMAKFMWDYMKSEYDSLELEEEEEEEVM